MTTTSLDAERRSRRSFTASDVIAAANITYRQLDYWTRTGLVDASGHPAAGSGDHRWYRDTDVLRICVIAAMLTAGISLASIREQIDTVLTIGGYAFPNVTITVDVDRLRQHVDTYQRRAS
jgi:DNA-binding transcriptional MerR regulator